MRKVFRTFSNSFLKIITLIFGVSESTGHVLHTHEENDVKTKPAHTHEESKIPVDYYLKESGASPIEHGFYVPHNVRDIPMSLKRDPKKDKTRRSNKNEVRYPSCICIHEF